MPDLQDAEARTRQLAADKRAMGETVVADTLDVVLTAMNEARQRLAVLQFEAAATQRDLDQERANHDAALAAYAEVAKYNADLRREVEQSRRRPAF